MSANLPPRTLAVKDWLSESTLKLSNIGIESARLDAEIILADSINNPRPYLHAHNDEMLDITTIKNADKKLSRRLLREPIAYIVGYKDFYGRIFSVNTDTLIPRPESEDIIEVVKQIFISHSPYGEPTPNPRLVDVGTGSGCLGITAKLEFPFLEVTLTDISDNALIIAKQNAKKFDVDVKILNSDLLQNYNDKANIIIANLPYVGKNWARSPETDFEPALALFADNRGLSIVKKLIVQASQKISHNGYVIIEADPVQHDSLIKTAKKHCLIHVFSKNYIVALKSCK